MQFSSSSPSIPDRLIWRRDEGNVVFMCGAGVSMPSDGANLPNFCKLTKEVIENLRVREDSNARVMLDTYMKKGMNIPIPYDQVFTELEEEFSPELVRGAICESLVIAETADTKYHKMIQELATCKYGKMKLITTNFDGLFSFGLEHQEYTYPNFPKNIKTKGFSGLVNLHGKCKKYNDSDEGKLVFSMESFGKAYVSSGEVTDFLNEVFSKYTVVFIGCSVDDPPMRYYLSAIADSDMSKYNVYVLQGENQKSVESRWKSMKVKQIRFDSFNCLWETLSLWCDRATKFDTWAASVLEMAQQDPLKLEKWEISQVIHLANHPLGAEKISDHPNPIHENWIFLFDPKFCNIIWPEEKQKKTSLSSNNSFPNFSFENSIGNIKSEDIDNEVYGGDVFDVSPFDGHSSTDWNDLGRINGRNSENLLDRHNFLSDWITKISAKPIVARWAIHQNGLHPALCDKILKHLGTSSNNVEKIMLQVWEDIFESWKTDNQSADLELGQLQNIVKKSKWTSGRVQTYEKLLRPRLKAIRLDRDREMEREIGTPCCVEDVVTFSPEYTNTEIGFSDIDDLEVELMKADRRNLDVAIKLEGKSGQYMHLYLPEILDNVTKDIINGAEIYDIASLAFRYLKRFHRVLNWDVNAALDEYSTWPKDDINIYGHFRVWALHDPKVISDRDVASTITSLPSNFFWEDRYNLDLRYSIANRWKGFSMHDVLRVQEKIVLGDPRYDFLNDTDCMRFKACKSLNMIQLLRDSGCVFESDIDDKIEELKTNCPKWTHQDAIDFDRMLRLKPGIVTKNADYSVLKHAPRHKIADIAETSSGYNVLGQEEDVPFFGFCLEKPDDAISTLRFDASIGNYRRELWGDWFKMDWEDERYRKYLSVTTETLCSASNKQLERMSDYVYYWFSKSSGLYIDHVQKRLRNNLFEKLLCALKSNPSIGSSVYERQDQERIEWEAEAINAPAGQLARALLCYREFESLSDSNQLPLYWRHNALKLLSLEGDSQRFALIPFTQCLQKLHWHLPSWSRNNILGFLKSNNTDTVDAFWEGFSKCPIQDRTLFLEIKDSLLNRVVVHSHMTRGVLEYLSNWVLSGWISKLNGKRLVTNEECEEVLVRGTKKVRELILTYLRNWESPEEGTTTLHMQEVEEFIFSVWPLSKEFITEYTNIRLVELLILNPVVFQKVSSRVIPNLRYSKPSRRSFHVPLDKVIEFAKEYPKGLLDILFYTLPNDIYVWPEHVSEMLDAIKRADGNLVDSKRFRFIQRRLEEHRQ